MWVDSPPLLCRLRNRRFRVVSEQGKTEERRGTTRNGIFGFGRMLVSPHFACGLWFSFLFFAPKRHGNACYAG